MLPQSFRLKKRQDFDRIFREGIYWKGKYLSIKTAVNAQTQGCPQVGIVVTKKYSKSAVQRNRIKRQVRAIFREYLMRLGQGTQVVVLISHPQIELSFQELRDDLCQLLIKSQVLHGN